LENTSLIDSTLEGFAYYPESDAITPLCTKKRWTKKELIAQVNARANKPKDAANYPMTSLSNKTSDRVFGDLVALLDG